MEVPGANFPGLDGPSVLLKLFVHSSEGNGNWEMEVGWCETECDEDVGWRSGELREEAGLVVVNFMLEFGRLGFGRGFGILCVLLGFS